MRFDVRCDAPREECPRAIDEAAFVIDGRSQRDRAGVHGADRFRGIAAVRRITDGRSGGGADHPQCLCAVVKATWEIRDAIRFEKIRRLHPIG